MTLVVPLTRSYIYFYFQKEKTSKQYNMYNDHRVKTLIIELIRSGLYI